MHKGVDLEAEEREIARSDGKNRTLRISTSIRDHSDGIPRIMAIMHSDFCAAVKKPYQIRDMGRVLHAVVHA